MPLPRLRQVALVAADLAPVALRLRRELGLDEPFRDPGVAEFGLENVVFAVGDTFLEVVAPAREDTAAGRYLARRGGDGGYMAIFQVADMAAARRRIAALGIRVVWQADLPDIAGTHLHPGDTGGAIVSLDQPTPDVSWRWGGPRWVGGAPPHRQGGLVGLTVATPAPADRARRWGDVLDAPVGGDGTSLALDGGRQTVSFVGCDDRSDEGIVAVEARVGAGTSARSATVGSAAVALFA